MILSRLLFALTLLEVEDYYRIETADEPAISPTAGSSRSPTARSTRR
jgi:hypothetical protein